MPDVNSLLFVYGTLRGAARSMPAIDLRLYGKRVAFGFVRGRLHRITAGYPGIVAGTDRIAGELWRLRDPARSLRLLDLYEGSEYRRDLVPISLTTGPVRAWVYRFNGRVPPRSRIAKWR